MCKVYNSVGSLSAVKSHLRRHNIDEFKSLNEVIAFQKNFSVYRHHITSAHELLIEQEKEALRIDISKLNDSINADKINIETQLRNELEILNQRLNDLSYSISLNFIQRITNSFKKRSLRNRIRNQELSLEAKVQDSLRNSVKIFNEKTNRYEYLLSNFTDAVNKSCLVPVKELERKKRIIDEVNPFIYGALGEQKVVEELENLSDEYFLINDFSLSFRSPIYNRQENDYIKSIQIDHVLVSPSGVFLIETKNWSKESLSNVNFRSPVKQIKRTNFALFKILSEEINKYNFLNLFQHHWGDKKIPIRNLIVLTNLKPKEEFQFVKVLSLNEILGYINYFKPIFSNRETQNIAHYLLGLIDISDNG